MCVSCALGRRGLLVGCDAGGVYRSDYTGWSEGLRLGRGELVESYRASEHIFPRRGGGKFILVALPLAVWTSFCMVLNIM